MAKQNPSPMCCADEDAVQTCKVECAHYLQEAKAKEWKAKEMKWNGRRNGGRRGQGVGQPGVRRSQVVTVSVWLHCMMLNSHPISCHVLLHTSPLKLSSRKLLSCMVLVSVSKSLPRNAKHGLEPTCGKVLKMTWKASEYDLQDGQSTWQSYQSMTVAHLGYSLPL